MPDNSLQVKQETRLLSRYIGLKTTKYITFVLLLSGGFLFNMTALYIALLELLLPALLHFLFSSTTKSMVPSFCLPHTMHKYHFTLDKYRAEKSANPILLFLLLFWQVSLNTMSYGIPWNIFPALLIICNIILRLIIPIAFRFLLHHHFMSLHTLEE